MTRQPSIGRPLVSILIPAFNAEQWISDTIRSALAQSWDNKEIIVVDDGSSDRTLAIARRFEGPCVQVATQKNQGAATARNTAFSLCHGDYIQWLDADDLLAPDKISRQMEALGQAGDKRTLLSSPWGRFIYRQSQARFIPTALWQDLAPIDWLLLKLGQNLFMQTATWLVSRELTTAAGPWNTNLIGDDDGEYFCRVLLASNGTRFVPDAKVYYRGPGVAFGGTLSSIWRSDRKLIAHWRSMELHVGYLTSLERSERVRAACQAYLQSSMIYFYPDQTAILKQAQQLAVDVGLQLEKPTMRGKYFWVEKIFGWRFARGLQMFLRKIRWTVQQYWDKALFVFSTMAHSRKVEPRAPGQENLRATKL